MKTYKAKRTGFIIYILIFILILPVVIFLMDIPTFSANPIILMPLLVPIIGILWIYFDTLYKIEEDKLIYKSGFLRGKIDIQSIREIIKGKTLYSGIKPAMARKGLIIKYDKFDEIYIAPANNDEMVDDLLKINPSIKVTQHQPN